MIQEIRRAVGKWHAGMTVQALVDGNLPWQARCLYLLNQVDTMQQTMERMRREIDEWHSHDASMACHHPHLCKLEWTVERPEMPEPTVVMMPEPEEAKNE